jgi:hypothetical protein
LNFAAQNRPLTTSKTVHFSSPTAPGVFRKIGVFGKNQGVKYAKKQADERRQSTTKPGWMGVA